MDETQADGLVNRSIHQLKKQGLVNSEGPYLQRSYTFEDPIQQLARVAMQPSHNFTRR